MRLLIDARPLVDSATGGVGRVALEIVDAYSNTFRSDEIVCVTTGAQRPTLPQRLSGRNNIRHCHINIPNKLWSVLCLLGLASLIRSTERRIGKVDAAFFPNIGFIGQLPTHRLIVSSTPSALLLHDLSFLIEPRWFTWKQRLWHRAVDAKKLVSEMPQLFSVSETTKRDAMTLLGIPADRIVVIPIGPTLSSTHHAPRTTGRYLMALGANDPRKNIATAKAAVDALRKDPRYADITLVIPTDKPSDAELASLYTNASAFLYPSWYEGYGLPLHEAASFGTPCIASTSGALPETAPKGTLFANPAKPHQWVEVIRLALGTPRPSPITPNPSAWTSTAQTLRSTLQH